MGTIRVTAGHKAPCTKKRRKLRPERGSYIGTLRPKAILYRYMEPCTLNPYIIRIEPLMEP